MYMVTIIKNTILNEMRNKGLYLLLVTNFGVLTMGFLLLKFVLDNNVDPDSFKMIGSSVLPMSYGVVNFWTSIVAIILGINCVKNDESSSTLGLLLSLPLKRYEYLIGRALGAWLLSLGFFIVSMVYCMLFLSFISKEFIFDFNLVLAFLLGSLILLVSVVYSIIFSQFTNRLMSFILIVISSIIFAVAQANFDLTKSELWFEGGVSIYNAIGFVLFMLFPHTTKLSEISSKLIDGKAFMPTELIFELVHYSVSIALILFVFNIFFNRRDIK